MSLWWIEFAPISAERVIHFYLINVRYYIYKFYFLRILMVIVCGGWSEVEFTKTPPPQESHFDQSIAYSMFALKKQPVKGANWPAVEKTAYMLAFFGTLRGLFHVFQFVNVQGMIENYQRS